jgi:hypothetical protein
VLRRGVKLPARRGVVAREQGAMRGRLGRDRGLELFLCFAGDA